MFIHLAEPINQMLILKNCCFESGGKNPDHPPARIRMPNPIPKLSSIMWTFIQYSANFIFLSPPFPIHFEPLVIIPNTAIILSTGQHNVGVRRPGEAGDRLCVSSHCVLGTS